MTAPPVFVLYLILGFLAVLLYFVFASFYYGAGYQPTPRPIATRMLELAEIAPTDVVYDLGAGTGALVFRAARERGARAVGVEVEPLRILILRMRRRWGPAAERIRIVWGDFFRLDFREATVVLVFLWPEAMRRLGPRLADELPKGARVVSYYHPVPGWTPSAIDDRLKVYQYRR
ncbi:MAG: SAM-dependent methyltransferase [Thermoplasmata archaeon]|nr:SAM-dependent methyltransferase [Thermoplasmata archaeon]